MDTSLIKTVWARITGKKAEQASFYFGDHSTAVPAGEQPDAPAEYAMTATGSAVPILDLFSERARAETLVRMATMSLLDRVGGAVKALTERYPVPVRSDDMSKAEIHRVFQVKAAQVLKQAEAAEQLSSALVKLGDIQLANAMAEWAAGMKASAAGTKRHIEDPGYLAWLNEPESHD
ncbi:hypothetical protein [Ectopseudomonas mendocina]|uniref:Uncharacterized protein n=1 Tax=Ectopseudomonas mendocina S5.2 TaxID=1225174 RepID=A0ABM5W3F7_ECTME|nr:MULTISPECIES: hypothetical protein [Pseudomonas aeruginosa group]ALN21792.1 hypothetical protein DW68_024245 [Pseudomonas mendocina S5.2]KER98151.1 hypothetical protein HN51_25480 [Pseudomonas mendocina]